MATYRAKAEININAPLKQVFLFTTNLKNLPHWGDVFEVKVVKETPNHVGSRYEASVKSLFGKTVVTLEIMAYTFLSYFSFRDHSTKSDYVFCFEQTQTGSKVVLENVLEGLTFSSTDKRLLKLLTNLKNYVETNLLTLGGMDALGLHNRKKQILHRDA